MIQSNELRLGNWLLPNHDLDGDYSQVSSLEVCYEGGKHYIVNGYKDGFFYSPIPLTPEILEKAGFVRSDDDYGGWLSKEILRQQPHTVSQLRIREDSLGFYYDNTFTTRITSLHQLQNLYFALTGEELPIEL